LAVLALFAASSIVSAEAGDQRYLRELIELASQAKLSEDRNWHVLLHYRKTLTGDYESEQDDPGFFLSPNGKTDPQAELEATLAGFFSEELVGRSKQPAQCAFIARYHWLKEKLAIDDRRLPPIKCERFDRWFSELNAEAVSLIFPAAFMNNPASMFGHTLLRLDQKGQTEQTRLLAYTINYAAEVPEGSSDLLYPIRGIFGLYQGYFMTPPYYLKVQEYGDIEHRDIWEYRLTFTEPQIRRMLMHAWELGNASFDYFFFKENCSYHILSLLEVADPTLRLTDRFVIWTVPADTVRALTEQPGLVGEVVYRPSRSTLIRRKRERLSEAEDGWLHRILRDTSVVQTDKFAQLPVDRRAFVLDIASDYLLFRAASDEAEAARYREQNRTVLTARSALRIPSEVLKIEPYTRQPEIGHKTSRAGVGAGWRNDETYEELTLRAGYHDLLDPQPGYTPGAQIELLAASLRHYNGREQTRLERLTFANVLSLSPVDSLFRSPSWKINVGMNTVRFSGCGLCSNGVANGGAGVTLETPWLNRALVFAFAEAEANYSHAYAREHRVGGGGSAGMLADLTDRWRMMLTTSYLRFPLGDKSDDVRLFVGQRYTLGQNWALRLEYNHRDHDDDVVFSVQAFF
jgi:hypothetical protein